MDGGGIWSLHYDKEVIFFFHLRHSRNERLSSCGGTNHPRLRAMEKAVLQILKNCNAICKSGAMLRKEWSVRNFPKILTHFLSYRRPFVPAETPTSVPLTTANL